LTYKNSYDKSEFDYLNKKQTIDGWTKESHSIAIFGISIGGSSRERGGVSSRERGAPGREGRMEEEMRDVGRE